MSERLKAISRGLTQKTKEEQERDIYERQLEELRKKNAELKEKEEAELEAAKGTSLEKIYNRFNKLFGDP